MSLSVPTSTTSGEDLKRRPTDSYRFGCPIKHWAVIPSNRMEWMHSCCHTSSSRPPHRFGRPVCLFVAFLPLAWPGFVLPRVFLWIPSTLRPPPPMYVCLFFHTQTDVQSSSSSRARFIPSEFAYSTCLFYHNPCACAHLYLSPFPFCYTQLTHAGVLNQVVSSLPSVVLL